jgi:ABC-type multidrug transport system ATPase subunit
MERSNPELNGASAPVLSIEDARRAFGQVRALDGLDLTVRSGEWVALLGANGAGKTTLIRAIGGRMPLDGGRIEILGERVDGRPRARMLRRLGSVPQEPALYDVLSVRENLETFATFHGVARSERRARVRWALDWTGLASRADERAGRLSGGMRRRLHIACGVLHRPAVLLLDEPTVGVDVGSRGRILTMLDGLRREGTALIHSSHELREIERVTDRAVVLRSGRIVADGAPADLVRRHAAARRTVRLTLAAPVTGLHGDADLVVDGCEIRGRLDDPARDLPVLLARVEAAGGAVLDLHVDAPGLEDVIEASGVDVARDPPAASGSTP